MSIKKLLKGVAAAAGIATVATAVAGVVTVIGGIAGYKYITSNPYPWLNEKYIAQKTAKETKVKCSDKVTDLGTLTDKEHREPISDDKIPDMLKNAAMGSEDKHFPYDRLRKDNEAKASTLVGCAKSPLICFRRETGVSLESFARAAYNKLRHKGSLSGVSTIDMQLAKQLIREERESAGKNKHNPEWLQFSEKHLGEKYSEKAYETVAAMMLHEMYSPEKIMELWFNLIHVEGNKKGIVYASEYFFGTKELNELNLRQMAFLVGMVKGPGNYDPTQYDPVSEKDKLEKAYKRAVERTGHVLKSMRDMKSIDEATYQNEKKDLQEKGIGFSPGRFRFEASTEMQMVRKEVKRDDIKKAMKEAGCEDISVCGATIYTTVDDKLDKITRYRLAERMSDLEILLDDYWKEAEKTNGVKVPRPRDFLQATVEDVVLKGNKSHIKVRFGNYQGTIDYDALKRLGAFVAQHKAKNMYLKPDDKKIQDAIKDLDFKKGDRIYCSIREQKGKDFILDVEQRPDYEGAISNVEKNYVSIKIGSKEGVIDSNGMAKLASAGFELKKNSRVFFRIVGEKNGKYILEPRIQRPLQFAGIFLNSEGGILTAVGSYYNNAGLDYVTAKGANSGSGAKPIINALAIDEFGWSITDILNNYETPFVVDDKLYEPVMDHLNTDTEVTMITGIKKSENLANIWLYTKMPDKLSDQKLMEKMKKYGMTPKEGETPRQFHERMRDKFAIRWNIHEVKRYEKGQVVSTVSYDIYEHTKFNMLQSQKKLSKEFEYGVGYRESIDNKIKRLIEKEDKLAKAVAGSPDHQKLLSEILVIDSTINHMSQSYLVMTENLRRYREMLNNPQELAKHLLINKKDGTIIFNTVDFKQNNDNYYPSAEFSQVSASSMPSMDQLTNPYNVKIDDQMSISEINSIIETMNSAGSIDNMSLEAIMNHPNFKLELVKRAVYDFALKIGIESIKRYSLQDISSSIVLGMEETPMEFALAYSAIMTGKLCKPHIIDSIVKDGKVIYKAKPQCVDTGIKQSTSEAVAQLLMSVTQHGGTAAQINDLECVGNTYKYPKVTATVQTSQGPLKVVVTAGGKTGTSNAYKDGSFTGFAANIINPIQSYITLNEAMYYNVSFLGGREMRLGGKGLYAGNTAGEAITHILADLAKEYANNISGEYAIEAPKLAIELDAGNTEIFIDKRTGSIVENCEVDNTVTPSCCTGENPVGIYRIKINK